MLKQGSFLCHLLTWLLLPQFIQSSSAYTCDSCGYKCWKCIGSTEVPNYLGNDLEILYLSDNTLNSINGNSFSIYRNIRELYLNNCSLKYIPNDTFMYLKDLELVDLSHNKISDSLPETIFQENMKLKQVILNYNNFSRIKTPFLSSGSIHTLHMIGNNISDVSSESFQLLPQLVELNLEKNRLKALPPNLFTPLQYFSKLFIDYSTLVANEPFQNCIPGLRVYAGRKTLVCGTEKSEITTYTAGSNTKFESNQTVTPPITQSRETPTQSSKITNDIKYTQRTTFGLSTSTPQLFTNEKVHTTKSTVSTPANTRGPTQTFPNNLVTDIEIKIIYLLLIIAFVLLLTLLLYVTVKYCSRTSSHSSRSQQLFWDPPNYATSFPGTFYDRLVHSNENSSIVQLYSSSSGPVHATLVPLHTYSQTHRPVSMASHHSYQEILYNDHNMVNQ